MQFSINLHVVNLLRAKGVCALPGIGELQVRRIASDHHASDVYRPNLEVQFHADAAQTDAPLLLWIQHAENISSALASLSLDAWLDALKAGASSEQGYAIEGLGTFKRRHEQWQWFAHTQAYFPETLAWPLPKTAAVSAVEALVATQDQKESSETPLVAEQAKTPTEAQAKGIKAIEQPPVEVVKPEGLTDKLTATQAETTLPKPKIETPVVQVPVSAKEEAKKTKEKTDKKIQESTHTAIVPEEDSQPKKSSGVLWFVLLFLLVMLGGGYWYWSNQYNDNPEVYTIISEMPVPEITDTNIAEMATDTSGFTAVDTSAQVVGVDSMQASVSTTQAGTYQVVVYQFNTLERAEKQSTKYAKNGNVSRVVMRADSQYLVIIQAITTQPDTAKIVDSIRRFFNPKGNLYLYK